MWSFLSVVVITCALHAQGRRFDPGRKQSVSVCWILLYEEISLYSFICLHVGTRDFFTYADIELFGFPTFKLSNRPSVLKLVQTSSRGVYQSYWNVGCFLQDQRRSAKLRDKIKIVLVICGPSDISGPCLMFKDDLDPRVPKEVLMPIFPHVLER